MALTLKSVVLVASILAAATAVAADRQLLKLPASFSWFSPPDNPALHGAWVLGAEKEPGTYVLRVRLAKGGRIALHIHPDTRYATVLSGTLRVGLGTHGETDQTWVVPTGGVYVIPANVPHHLWAKDSEVVYQEAGTGPTGNLPPPP